RGSLTAGSAGRWPATSGILSTPRECRPLAGNLGNPLYARGMPAAGRQPRESSLRQGNAGQRPALPEGFSACTSARTPCSPRRPAGPAAAGPGRAGSC
ncbi:hypothetical protein EN830_33930, partial [Mesorhizobium sp. M1C.F.Ca.ET.187.01.1.1]